MRLELLGPLLLVGAFTAVAPARRALRRARETRGRRTTSARSAKARGRSGSLRFGNALLPESAATSHFLFVGTTGSGKTLLQRLLMKDVLSAIRPGSDRRAFIFDAKGDTLAFLRKIGVTCPVLSMNPFESRDFAVRWDIAKDVTSPARALTLASSLIPREKGGNNQYFTDSARHVVAALAKSLIRHSPGRWTFSDFIFATLSLDRVRGVLDRDEEGRAVLKSFFSEERTGYQVFSTVVSRMSYFEPIAALWQRTTRTLSLRDWLSQDSILLVGSNETVRAALDAVNEIIFRTLGEEVDAQVNSATRRTWFWIDEARLAESLLRSGMVQRIAVKHRSRGACLVLGFQDVEGFREAVGPRIANEIIAQCSNKALLRMESDESAAWASRVLGQYETLDAMSSEGVEILRRSRTISESRIKRDAVLPSEFYEIPVTSSATGLTGYFVSPYLGAYRGTVAASEIGPVVPSECEEKAEALVARAESEQWLKAWTMDDERRLLLEIRRESENAASQESTSGKRLNIKRVGRYLAA